MTTHKHALTLGYKHTERECGLKPRLCVCVCSLCIEVRAPSKRKKEKSKTTTIMADLGRPCPAQLPKDGRTNVGQ